MGIILGSCSFYCSCPDHDLFESICARGMLFLWKLWINCCQNIVTTFAYLSAWQIPGTVHRNFPQKHGQPVVGPFVCQLIVVVGPGHSWQNAKKLIPNLTQLHALECAHWLVASQWTGLRFSKSWEQLLTSTKSRSTCSTEWIKALNVLLCLFCSQKSSA